jgi:hypothetical protein
VGLEGGVACTLPLIYALMTAAAAAETVVAGWKQRWYLQSDLQRASRTLVTARPFFIGVQNVHLLMTTAPSVVWVQHSTQPQQQQHITPPAAAAACCRVMRLRLRRPVCASLPPPALCAGVWWSSLAPGGVMGSATKCACCLWRRALPLGGGCRHTQCHSASGAGQVSGTGVGEGVGTLAARLRGWFEGSQAAAAMRLTGAWLACFDAVKTQCGVDSRICQRFLRFRCAHSVFPMRWWP